MGINIHSSAIVDDGAQIGDSSRVWHFVHICGGARIGNNVKVQNNVSIYDGVPARQAGWMSRHGERLEFKDGEAVCSHTGDRYRLADGVCELIG